MRALLVFIFLLLSMQIGVAVGGTICLGAVAVQESAQLQHLVSPPADIRSSVIQADGISCGHSSKHRDCSGCHLIGATLVTPGDEPTATVNAAPVRVSRVTFIPSDVQELIERPKWLRLV